MADEAQRAKQVSSLLADALTDELKSNKFPSFADQFNDVLTSAQQRAADRSKDSAADESKHAGGEAVDKLRTQLADSASKAALDDNSSSEEQLAAAHDLQLMSLDTGRSKNSAADESKHAGGEAVDKLRTQLGATATPYQVSLLRVAKAALDDNSSSEEQLSVVHDLQLINLDTDDELNADSLVLRAKKEFDKTNSLSPLALRLYEDAALYGSTEALKKLASAYKEGKLGLPKNPAKARFYEIELQRRNVADFWLKLFVLLAAVVEVISIDVKTSGSNCDVNAKLLLAALVFACVALVIAFFDFGSILCKVASQFMACCWSACLQCNQVWNWLKRPYNRKTALKFLKYFLTFLALLFVLLVLFFEKKKEECMK